MRRVSRHFCAKQAPQSAFRKQGATAQIVSKKMQENTAKALSFGGIFGIIDI